MNNHQDNMMLQYAEQQRQKAEAEIACLRRERDEWQSKAEAWGRELKRLQDAKPCPVHAHHESHPERTALAVLSPEGFVTFSGRDGRVLAVLAPTGFVTFTTTEGCEAH